MNDDYLKDDIRRTMLEVVDGDNDTNMNDGIEEVDDIYLSDSNADDLYNKPQMDNAAASNYTNIASNTSYEGNHIPYFYD